MRDSLAFAYSSGAQCCGIHHALTSSMMTPTKNEKLEWARLAQDAYAHGENALGHRFSSYASIKTDAEISTVMFDSLMSEYRRWLIDGLPALLAFIERIGVYRDTVPGDIGTMSHLKGRF